ncbi:hypothetical protein DEO72_LG3g638 [Vigna unguiculata]|uniref:Uncharacterized protein n=1 Tax=Vigna unguiculata TaxID=3917 RepID=A0A4D6LC37_VIGUN|nr:hypothetical protein DEO72_LG3g638 [Vigna unguiculata]
MHIEIIFASAGVDVERLHSRGYGVISSNVGGGDLLLALMGYGWKGSSEGGEVEIRDKESVSIVGGDEEGASETRIGVDGGIEDDDVGVTDDGGDDRSEDQHGASIIDDSEDHDSSIEDIELDDSEEERYANLDDGFEMEDIFGRNVNHVLNVDDNSIFL